MQLPVCLKTDFQPFRAPHASPSAAQVHVTSPMQLPVDAMEQHIQTFKHPGIEAPAVSSVLALVPVLFACVLLGM
jgi:hypothetical protein